jgi:hypothetical protein
MSFLLVFSLALAAKASGLNLIIISPGPIPDWKGRHPSAHWGISSNKIFKLYGKKVKA